MRKSRSIRRQTLLLMSLLVLFQSLSLSGALALSGVFPTLDAESVRLFSDNVSARADQFNASVGALIDGLADTADQIGVSLDALCVEETISPKDLHLRNDTSDAASRLSTDLLLRVLQNNRVSGGFVIFEDSSLNTDDSSAHAAVYLRNASPEVGASSNANFSMELGPAALAQEKGLRLGVNWGVDIFFSDADISAYDYYNLPLNAISHLPQRAQTQLAGYWSPPTPILGDNQSVILYTLPLRSNTGDVYGIIGIEISKQLFASNYLPFADLPYRNSFYIVANVKDDMIDLGWMIPSGPLADSHVQKEGFLPLSDAAAPSIKETTLPTLGSMYCAPYALRMYSDSSPFQKNGAWNLIGFVSRDALHETSSRVLKSLAFSIIATTIIALAIMFFFTHVLTKNISSLTGYVDKLAPTPDSAPASDIIFPKTGLSEIDQLTSSIETLNRSVANSSQSISKIMDLTEMPMGGFDIPNDSPYVFITSYIFSLLELPLGEKITKARWQELYAAIVKSPEAGYENVYHVVSSLGEERSLRVMEASTDMGRVGLISDVTSDIERAKKLAYELDYDVLTGLYSGQGFRRRVAELIASAPEQTGSLVFLDLDNLKHINDNYGHDTGDLYIREAGKQLHLFHERDGIVSRVSGDEFIVYLHNVKDKRECFDYIHKTLNSAQQNEILMPDGSRQRIRSSAGVSWYPSDAKDVSELIRLADFAMYEAKHSMKGTLFNFSRHSYDENAYLLKNKESINRLIDEEAITFFYQPIIHLQTGHIVAYELLMRSLLPEFKSPLEIIGVATAQSKLNQIEELVTLKALSSVNHYQDAFKGKLAFINTLPSYLLTDDVVKYIHATYRDLLPNIIFEITETESLDDAILQKKLEVFRTFDAKIAIDDYGSGYSNELRLLELMPQVVKLDMGIIRDIDKDENKQHMAYNILSFCNARNIMTIAEGVEREGELRAVQGMGITCVQGFLTARPAPEPIPLDPAIVDMIRSYWL